MKARLLERRRGERMIVFDETNLSVSGYHSEYALEGAKTLFEFEDGTPAAQMISYGKGRVCLLGFSLGYAVRTEAAIATWAPVFNRLIQDVSLESEQYADLTGELDVRRLYGNEEQLLFLVNTSAGDRRIKIHEKVIRTLAQGRMEGSEAVVPAKSCMIIMCNAN